MKRFVIFIFTLLLLTGAYNFDVLRNSFYAAQWDRAYNLDRMTEAWAYYSQTEASGALQRDTLYNLGNAFYRLGEKDETKRMELWQKSIDAYSGSLSYKKEQHTEDNLEYVRKKLQTLIQIEEESKESSGQPSMPEPTASGGTQDQSKAWEESKDGKTWSNNGAYSPIWGEGSNAMESKLSNEQLLDLKKYIEQMNAFQKENSRLLNPTKLSPKGGISDELRNFLGDDSLFESTLNGSDGKKDW